MIRFDIEFGQAFIIQDSLDEEGWIFKYNSQDKNFHIWRTVIDEISGMPSNYIVNSLEEVYTTIQKFK